jgi:type 1 fimbria pilin
MKKLVTLSFVAITCFVAVIGCSKNDDNTGTLSVRLTDAPYNAQQVNVDIKEVRVNFKDDSTGWVTLTSVPGVYDLLAYQNGKDTLIGKGTYPYGTVKEIRLILGSNNTIKINNVVYPLTISSGEESGLKIKVKKDLRTPNEVMVIDFDAALSIYQNGNGDYKLKPVIKLK